MTSKQQIMFSQLTKYPVGSLREMTALSAPLMLSALSGALMMFFDRFILAHYSISAMNAAVTAGMSVLVFQILVIGVASIAEVYVGQHYGAKEYNKVASPVWQMIWFSLACSLILIPIAQLIPEAFIPERFHIEGASYFKILLSFSALVGINAALCAFFIGQGKVKLITYVVILGNIINIIADIALIFGISFWFEPMGTKGAAIATIISQVFQSCVLFFIFLNKDNRSQFDTHIIKFDFYYFWQCFKIGLPNALGHMIEFAAWSIQLHLLSMASVYHITVATIGQSIFGLVAFTTEGLQKAIIAIVSNLIGAKYYSPIKRVFRSAFSLHLIIALLIVTPLALHPEWFLNDFLTAEKDPYMIQMVFTYAKVAAYWIFLYFIFDGLVWICAGFLTAYKDTLFILCANAFNAWFFALLPTYWFIVVKHNTPDKAWAMIVIYGFINMLCFGWRLRFKLKQNIIHSPKEIIS